MIPDFDRCYRIVQTRDRRFDGWFITAVHTTGIYCRPSCPATTPKPTNVSFYPSSAAAQLGGYRACKRCRPDATPGSPEWNHRSDLAGRAVRLIADGVIDREGVAGLARRLGYSERHVNRLMIAELGAPPVALARSQRAQNARVLIETTPLAMVDVAFAAGFSSLRQFNDTVRDVFAATPTELRSAARAIRHPAPTLANSLESTAGAAVTMHLRLAVRAPFNADHLFSFLAARVVGGIEYSAKIDGVPQYVRSLDLPYGHGLVRLSPGDGCVHATARLADVRDLSAAVARCRALLDLDADPVGIDRSFDKDPVMGPLVEARPGLRCPGSVDGYEMAVRAILGQQVSVSASINRVERLVRRYGQPLAVAERGEDIGSVATEVVHTFPDPAVIAEVDPAMIGVPRTRAKALIEVSRCCAAGDIVLDAGADHHETRAKLLAIRGVGPWTADYVALRALGDPDVLMSGDLVVRQEWERRGGDNRSLISRSGAWAPWRSTVNHHLWAAAASADRPAPNRVAQTRRAQTRAAPRSHEEPNQP